MMLRLLFGLLEVEHEACYEDRGDAVGASRFISQRRDKDVISSLLNGDWEATHGSVKETM